MGQFGHNSKATQKNSLQLIIAVMGMGLSFIADVYAMINMPDSYLVIGILSGLFLIATFLLVQAAVKLHMIKLARQEEVYDELFKSSKATYLMMRKSFGEMEDTVNNIGDIVKAPISEFMDEQKNISQITVNRSKENADALMNSNDKLLDKFFEFETTLENFEEEMLSKQKELIDNSVREITLKQQELSTVIKDSEFEIKKEMLSMSRPVMQPTMPAMEPVAEPSFIQNEVAVPPIEEVLAEEIKTEEFNVEETMEREETVELDDAFSMDDIADLLAEPPMEDIPAMPDLSDPNKMMSPEDIAALLASMNGPSEPVAEEEPIVELGAEPEEEPIAEQESEEKPPMPDLSDPNKIMSPEDIAALIANL